MTEPDRRQQILEGAMRLFSRKGYHNASIKGIAREAGIRSPALIYHYFDDKRALLEAVITEFSVLQGTPLVDGALRQQAMDLPPSLLLPQIANRVMALQENEDAVRLMRLYLAEAMRDEEVAAAAGKLQRQALDFIEGYLQHQVCLGRLRPHDSKSAARMLIGAGIAYIMGNEVFPAVAVDFPPRPQYVEEIIAIFLHGLEPSFEQSQP